MIRFQNQRARLLLICSGLMTSGCMGPNPWTVDANADCRSMGLTPGSTRFNECVLVTKELQAERKDGASPAQKSGADADPAFASRLQTRACDPTTGLCASSLLRQ